MAILQSNYIPWRGYFDIILRSDVFVFYDIVQYTKNDWRNRNIIKTPNGTQWLTIPVLQTHFEQTVHETQVANDRWRQKHWRTLCQNYGKAACFEQLEPQIRTLYLNSGHCFLSEINRTFICAICGILGINTRFVDARELVLPEGRTERLVSICQQFGARKYLTGPAAAEYLDTAAFAAAGVDILWQDYTGYPEYRQLSSPFSPRVSILDLLFNEGDNARAFISGG